MHCPAVCHANTGGYFCEDIALALGKINDIATFVATALR
jgi:hypothetical protein